MGVLGGGCVLARRQRGAGAVASACSIRPALRPISDLCRRDDRADHASLLFGGRCSPAGAGRYEAEIVGGLETRTDGTRRLTKARMRPPSECPVASSGLVTDETEIEIREPSRADPEWVARHLRAWWGSTTIVGHGGDWDAARFRRC